MPTPTDQNPPATPPVGISLQGWPVLDPGPRFTDAVYVRIPKDLQRPVGGCACRYCVAHPDEIPSWDTLGIPLRPPYTTWTVHAPEWKEKR